MKTYTLLALLLSISINLSAQKLEGQALVDSLLSKLPEAKEDSNGVILLNIISYSYSMINPKFGLKYAERGLEISEKIEWQKGIAISIYHIGVNYVGLSEHTKALKFFHKALNIHEGTGNKEQAAKNLHAINYVYMNIFDYHKAIEYSLKVLSYYELTGSEKVSKQLIDIGSLYARLADYSNAMIYANDALKSYEMTNNKEGIAISINLLGIIFTNTSRFHEAQDMYERALMLYEILGNEADMAHTLNNLGLLKFYLSEFDQALEYYYKSLNIHEKAGNKENIAMNLGNIGMIYSKLSEPTKALYYYNSALIIDEELGNKAGIARNNYHIGKIHNNLLFQYSKALEYFIKALYLELELGNKELIASIYDNIGETYTNLADYSRAQEYHNMSFKLFDEIGNKKEAAKSIGSIGVLMYNNGIENDDSTSIRESIEFLQKARKLAIDIGINDVRAINYLAKAYGSLGNYKNALELLKEYKTLQDSIFSVEKSTAIANLEAKRENEVKDKEIALLSKEKEIQQLELMNKLSLLKFRDLESAKQIQAIELLNKDNEIHLLSLGQKDQALVRHQLENKEQATQLEMTTLEKEINEGELQRQKSQKMNMLGGFGMFLLAGSGIFYFITYRRRTKFREKVVVTEMKALRAQMNPHFIFNALGSIHSFVLQNNNDNAAEYLLKFSTLMRLILNNSMEEYIPLDKEIRALELYMELESIRMAHRFSYDILIDPEIDEENTLIPPLLIQPFVENAVHHGIGHKNGPGYILVKLTKKDNMMHCIIEDNGVGRKKAMEMKGSFKSKDDSLGIKITNERLQIINQKSKGKGAISFTDLNEGLRVEINVPVEEVF